jgi:hypothetical protein
MDCCRPDVGESGAGCLSGVGTKRGVCRECFDAPHTHHSQHYQRSCGEGHWRSTGGMNLRTRGLYLQFRLV